MVIGTIESFGQAVKINQSYIKGDVELQFWQYKKILNPKDTNIQFNIIYPEIINNNDISVRILLNSKLIDNELEQKFKEFADEYKTSIADNPPSDEYPLDYHWIENWTVQYNSNGLLSLVNSISEATGGAHGNYKETSFNFDLSNGRGIIITDIISNQKDPRFIKLLMSKLAASVEMQAADLKDDFPPLKSDFKLTENFYFTSMAVVFIYSSGDFVSMGSGPNPEAVFPFDEIKPFLKKGCILEKLFKK